MQDHDMASTFRISNNAYKAYIQTRPVASVDSNKRVKNIRFSLLKPLVEFLDGKEEQTEQDEENAEYKLDLLTKMKQYKAKTTIFELNPKPDSAESIMMAQKRRVHGDKIARHHLKQQELQNDGSTQVIERGSDDSSADEDDEDSSRRKKKRKKSKPFEPSASRDKEYYIPHQPLDKVTEDGLAINSFSRDAQKAEFSLSADTNDSQRFNKTLQKWDRKKKKMVNVEDPRAGKMKTEHGVWIAASYKTDRYAKWRERSKIEDQVEHEADSDDQDSKSVVRKSHPHTHWGRHNAKLDGKNRQDPEMKSADQLVKKRIRSETLKHKEMQSKQRNDVKRKKAMSKKKNDKGKGKTKMGKPRAR